MDCPRCHHHVTDLAISCSACGFTADGRSWQKWSNLTFLLAEMASWDIPNVFLYPLRKRYTQQLQEVEIEVGLRQPPPTEAETHLLLTQLRQEIALQQAVEEWVKQGWIIFATAKDPQRQIRQSIQEIREKLKDAPLISLPSSGPKYTLRRLAAQKYILQTMQTWHESGWLSEGGWAHISAELEARIAALEIEAGLRAAPTKAAQAQSEDVIEESVETEKRWKRPSLTWDQVWESLLSERTLHALLFVGVILLLASGVSWLVWNWDTFPPLIQLAFLGGMTMAFFGMGWYVRTRMKLEGSGVALITVAALLIPLDFVAYYISGGFPPGSWPVVWFAASLVCLAAYSLITYVIHAVFFGYLIAVAIGSLMLSVLNLLGVPVEWGLTAVTTLTLALALTGEKLRRTQNQWRFLGVSFGHVALVASAPTMLVGLGWSILGGSASLAFYISLALSWWLGGLTLLVMNNHYRLQTLTWPVALSFPIAMWLTMNPLFFGLQIDTAWYAVGWLLLAPAYFGAAAYCQRFKDEEFWQAARKTAVIVAVLLIIIAALWSWQDSLAATCVYLLLAIGAGIAAWITQRSRLLWLMSLSLAISAGGWMASRGANPAELALPWTLLSIFHVIAALRVERRLPEERAAFLAPLYGAAMILAGAAVLPPLILFDQQLVIYALGNWLGMNGWLAILAHQQNAGLIALLSAPRLRGHGVVLLHWLVALPLIAWVILVWTISRPFSPQLGWVMLLLAWALMGAAMGLRRLRWAYGLPWQAASLISAGLALLLAFYDYDGAWSSWLVGGTAVYFLVVVWTFRSANYFHFAGLLFPVSWYLITEQLRVPFNYWQAGLGIFPLAYVLAGVWLEEKRGHERPFTKPFYGMALFVGIPMLAATLVWSLFRLDSDDLAWMAFTPAWLGLAAGLYAWLTQQSRWAHVGIWLVTLAGGFVVKAYSHGSGRSAALVACLAIAYVLAERGLHWLALRPGKTQWFDYRRVWLVFRRPLLTAGWVLSVAAIGAALVRNLVLLEGGTVRQMWSIVALLLVTGLYALSAWFYRREIFVWLASGLIIIPWFLTVHLIWGYEDAWFGLSGVVLGLILLAVGASLAQRLGLGKWSWPPQIIAHILVPMSLLLVIADPPFATFAVPLAVAFYVAATAVDRFYGTEEIPSNRFLFPAAALLPVWGGFVFAWISPTITESALAVVIWLFVLPLLALGRRIARWEATYRWPFYLVAYAAALLAMILAADDTAVLTTILFLNTGVAVLSVWLFREPRWWYPATILLPLAIWTLLDVLIIDEIRYYGWSWLAVAGLYLAGAWLLRQRQLEKYEFPLIVMTFVLTAAGLPFCSTDRLDAFVGYGMAVTILVLAAVWLRKALAFHAAVFLAIMPYSVVLSWLDVAANNLGFAMWPGILAALALAVYLDNHWGIEPTREQLKLSNVSFPWADLEHWPRAVWERLTRWWALSLYVVAVAFVVFSGMVGLFEAWRWLLVLLAGTAVFGWLTWRFQLRIWLLATGVWAQLTALAFIWLIGLIDSGAQVALAFMPVTLFTFFLGFLVEQGLQEKPILYCENGRWYLSLSGWSLPFYLLLFTNVGMGQLLVLDLGWESAIVTLLHALIIGILATHWRLRILAHLATAVAALALIFGLVWFDVAPTGWPTAFAILALVYGLSGYGLRRWQQAKLGVFNWMAIWERPLLWAGWVVSLIALFLALAFGIALMPSFVEVFVTNISLNAHETAVAHMLVRTFALLGLFYLTAALVERRYRLSYFALLMLFASWSNWLLLIQGARELQLYAVPAGFYLLGMGWLEWSSGNRVLARWLDWLGVLILYGSAFWQSFGTHGEVYAFLMIVEGLLIGWLGSLRRLRRLLYMGVLGVVTAVAGQLIEPLFALNTFVLLLLGAAVVGLAILLERRLEKVREFSHELRAKMEHWE